MKNHLPLKLKNMDGAVPSSILQSTLRAQDEANPPKSVHGPEVWIFTRRATWNKQHFWAKVTERKAVETYLP